MTFASCLNSVILRFLICKVKLIMPCQVVFQRVKTEDEMMEVLSTVTETTEVSTIDFFGQIVIAYV